MKALSPATIPTPAPRSPALAAIRLPVNSRVCLVDVNAIRTHCGCDADRVFEDVENGKYLYVFNLARQPGTWRELRFWINEVAAPESMAGLSLPEVVNHILPANRAWFSPGDVCLRFLITRPTYKRIRHEISQPVGNVKREPLAQWLQARWVGRLATGQNGRAAK